MTHAARQEVPESPDFPAGGLAAAWRAEPAAAGPLVNVPVAALLAADSPRLAGEDLAHARALATSDAVLPPIVVHRTTMRVIDGMHRLHAASMRGEDTVRVQFFNGTAANAFVLAVELNSTHGLPLSQADRIAAAGRILESHPRWSDRTIAATTGLSAKTVGKLRNRSTADEPQLTGRIGRDGRVRPIDAAAGRRLAAELLRRNPTATLREIAQFAGIAQATARDVRKRLFEGEDPIPERLRKPKTVTQPQQGDREDISTEANSALLVNALKKDPTLRFTDTGRALLRLLDSNSLNATTRAQMAVALPAHCLATVAKVARQHADSWRRFGQEIERRHHHVCRSDPA
jgi:hypothetical protein